MSNNEKIQNILDKNQIRIIEKTKILLSESFLQNNEELFNKIVINVQKHFDSINSITSKLMEESSNENIFDKIQEIVELKHSNLSQSIDKNIHNHHYKLNQIMSQPLCNFYSLYLLNLYYHKL